MYLAYWYRHKLQMNGDRLLRCSEYAPSSNKLLFSIIPKTILNTGGVFTAFGGPAIPDPNICNYTWMCSVFNNVHASSKGYSVIATTIENGIGY